MAEAKTVPVRVLVDYKLFRRGAWAFYGLVLVLLVAVLLKGRVVMGARRWLAIGPVNFQPSELAKIADELGVTRERVRQIQQDGLHRLKQVIAARGVRKDALL